MNRKHCCKLSFGLKSLAPLPITDAVKYFSLAWKVQSIKSLMPRQVGKAEVITLSLQVRNEVWQG